MVLTPVVDAALSGIVAVLNWSLQEVAVERVSVTVVFMALPVVGLLVVTLL